MTTEEIVSPPTADPSEPFDRIRFLDLLIGASRGSRGACLWCGEVLTRADERRDLCNACQKLMEAAR